MKKTILKLTSVIAIIALQSCSTAESKWTKEEVANQLCGCCFKGTDSYGGEQTTVFSLDGTWETSTNTPGYSTTNQDKGNWTIKDYDKQHNWWNIDLGNGKITNLNLIGSKGTLYIGGWGNVYHATKEKE